MTEPSKTSEELQKFLAILDTIPHGTIPVEITGDALCSLRGYIRTLQAKLEASEKENKRMKSALKEIRGETADNPINVYRTPVIIASEALSSLPTL